MSKSMNRRSFLQKSGAAVLGFTIVPSVVMGQSVSGVRAPSDKLNIAGVGIGGRGAAVIANMASENIVALCDVDWGYTERNGVFERYPNARKYWDYRKMLEEMGSSIDAVMVGTADHTHAIIAADAMTMGKHVYCEKPLTHSVYESRLLTKLAARYRVATQMGNQGSSGEGVRQTIDWISNGEIGEVTRVDCSSNRPIWPQGLNPPANGMWVPDTLNWDLFTGPAKLIPYHEIYTPWNWRGWWHYGTGALGDMACHVMDPIFKALKLRYPTKVQASSTLLLADCCPTAQSVKLTFPARPQHNTRRVRYPEVDVYWTDGGLLPMLPAGFPSDKRLDINGPAIFYGTKDTLICDCYGANPWLLSGRVPNAPKTQREVPGNAMRGGHEMDWVRACKESPENRVPCASDFADAGPFNEMVVMGVLAVRLQRLNRVLEWDGENMQFTNIRDNDSFNMTLADGFSITDGHPTFNNPSIRVEAKPFAQELIKHTYRNGWALPPMPT
jgi:predicted dehydrogenase